MSDPRHDHTQPRTPGVRHEETDLNLPGLLAFLASLGLSAVIVYLVVAVLFRAFTDGLVTDRQGRALSSVELTTLPARPIIESFAPESEPEISRLPDTYGWVDRERKIVRIPVERAKAIVADTHPAREGRPQSHAPTDANGGHPRKGP